MTISNEALEAAAERIDEYMADWYVDFSSLLGLSPARCREHKSEIAKAVLEAAAPLIAAQALREAAEELPPSRTKPRYEHINYFHWLRKRATECEAKS